MIEDKVIAEQKAPEAINNTKRITEEAEQKVITAKAEAKAMEIKAQALQKTRAWSSMRPYKNGTVSFPSNMLGELILFINLGK